MHGSRIRGAMRRSLVVVVLAGLGTTFVSTSPALAATTCTYNTTTHVATVTSTGFGPAVDIIRTPGTTFISVNATLCMGGPYLAATTTNTRRIVVNLNGDGDELSINLGLGAFAPGFGNEAGTSDEIEFVVNSGSNDWVALFGKSGADTFRLGTGNGRPRLNVNAKETTGIDADITVNGAGFLFVSGAGGNDRISANGGKGTGAPLSRSAVLVGGTGNDVLVGGAGGDSLHTSTFDADPDDHDVLNGMGGPDEIDAVDGDGLDEVNGGAGTDECIPDPGDAVTGC